MSKKIKKEKNNVYFSYGARVSLFLISSLVLIIFASIISKNNFKYIDEETVNYTERSNLDYKVYLKENNFYENEYLEKDMIYVSSLIDKINIDFVYDFVSTSNMDLNFSYQIVGMLEIKDENDNNFYFSKEYILKDIKEEIIKNVNNYTIKENVEIDYDYYNGLANQFKSLYGINTKSSFKIYMNLNRNSLDQNFTMSNNENMYVTIPLSQKSINIKLDYKDINNNSKVVNQKKVIINNYIQLLLAMILLILALLNSIKAINLLLLLRNKKSKYDRYINKILLEYDRLIVESNVEININEYNVFPIKQFKELLDARDNLKKPIIYQNIIKHQKCYFYVRNENDLYLMTVKAIDLDYKNEK